MLKAYMVFAGDPYDNGCVLVWAETANKAKVLGMAYCPMCDFDEYIYWRAHRKPDYDKYANPEKPVLYENSELPEGAPDFYTDYEI